MPNDRPVSPEAGRSRSSSRTRMPSRASAQAIEQPYSPAPTTVTSGVAMAADCTLAPLMAPSAVIFDFNGTISDDEGLLAELFERIFAEVGIDVPAALYFEEFAGYSDEEICERVLERFGRSGEPGLAEHLIAERTRLYLGAQRDHPTVRPEAAACVHEIAETMPGDMGT